MLGLAFHDPGRDASLPPPDAMALEAEADRVRAQVEEKLGPSPVETDELIRQCEASASAVLTVLLELELAGRVQRHSGNRVAWR
jgi:DNA processing protein